jgi:hypothetical protein
VPLSAGGGPRRASGIVVAAVVVVAVAAGCGGSGGGEAGANDEAQACSVAGQDYSSYASDIRSQFEVARRNTDMQDLGGIRAQAVWHAQAAANAWLISIEKLLGEDISPQLRQALTDVKASLEEIQNSGDQPVPPNPGPKLGEIDDALRQVCKGKS